jgi:small ligand-binding sensory domain FIST
MTSPEPFACGHAASPNWRDAAAQCLQQVAKRPTEANLGFLYVSDSFAGEVADILAYFRANTGILNWTGTVGIGLFANEREYYDEPAVAIMVCAFAEDSFRVFSGVRAPQDFERVSMHFGELPANFAIVHADPRNAQLPRLVTDLAGHMESGFVAGGLTSSRREIVQIANGASKGGLSGVLFSDDVVVSTRITQGCSPIGPRHTVTGSRQNILISLDGRAALDVFKEDIGEPAWDALAQGSVNVFAGLQVTGAGPDDYVVRNLVGIDTAQKLLAIGDVARPGAQIRFCRRDQPSATQDMARMLDSISSGLFGRPRGGIYFSCVGRGRNLFSGDSVEAGMIRRALDDVPLVGFFCNGEISHNRLYGYTGVLTLFS